jgi:hypothetical protein
LPFFVLLVSVQIGLASSRRTMKTAGKENRNGCTASMARPRQKHSASITH